MKSPKRQDVAETIAERVREGDFVISDHASDEMRDDQILFPEVKDVLLGGFHVPEYDQWDLDEQSWNYALRGWTEGGRPLRLAVAFSELDDAVVVTVIDLR